MISAHLNRIASIFNDYAPFMSPLGEIFVELSYAIKDNFDNFLDIATNKSNDLIMLFDSVSVDMDRYVERFKNESMIMTNIHHIHQPTTLSIKQIIAFIAPDDVEAGEIDFF